MICKQSPIKLLKRITLIYSTFHPSLVKKRIINYSNGLDLSIWIMNMEILIHELLHMFKRDSFQPFVTSQLSFYSSVEYSSRPNFAGSSSTSYDGSRGKGTNDGSDTRNDGGGYCITTTKSISIDSIH